MRTENVLFSAIHFFVVFFVLLVGAFSLALSKLVTLRNLLMESLLARQSFFFVFGYVLLGVGMALLIGLFVLNGKRYYQIKMLPHRMSVDLPMIQDYLEEHWKRRFPHEKILFNVFYTPLKKIELIVEVPDSLSSEEQNELIQRAEKEIGSFFADKLGYVRAFNLIVQFKRS